MRLRICGGNWPEEWWGSDIVISITFDLQGTVSAKSFETHDFGAADKRSLWEEACTRLPW
jgi:hypothetical protein